jgi:hypothetical protein
MPEKSAAVNLFSGNNMAIRKTALPLPAEKIDERAQNPGGIDKENCELRRFYD